MFGLTDLFDFVVDLALESQLAAVDGGEFGFAAHFFADRCGCHVADVDLQADLALPCLQMRLDDFVRGHFNEVGHRWR